VHHFHAILLEGLGLWDGSLVEQRRAAELDPFVPTYRDNVGQALHFLRRDNEAAVEYKRVLNLDSNFASSLGGICTYYADTGRLHEAEEILRDRLMPPYSKDPNAFMCAASIAYREQDRGKLEKISQRAEQLYRHGDLAAGWLPYPYAFMGEYDTAVRWLEKAYDDRDYGVFYAVRDPALPSAIVATPSWRALMQRPAFQEIARVRAQMMAQGG
jgi:tetratricopeptide (TPR) repeat protein